MKNKILILIVICVLICIALLLFMIFIEEEDDNQQNELGKSDLIIIENKTMKKVDNRADYYTIQNIVERYITAATIGQNSEQILGMFAGEYVKKYNVNIDNAINKTGIDLEIVGEQGYKFIADNIYVIERNDYLPIYFIYGNCYNLDNLNKYEMNLMVELDRINYTFSIYPFEYFEDNGYNKMVIGDDSVNIKNTEIDENKYNKYTIKAVSKREMANNYFNLLIWYLMNDEEKAYSLLDEDYSKGNFEDLKDFKNYINNNRVEIKSAVIDQYQVNRYEGYSQYICLDTDGKYYIVNEINPMDFTIVLDEYTTNNPKFIEKYEQATKEEKCILNIQKFINAINDKRYYFAYNCLAQSFKDNYFKTREDFENYIENNFYNENKINYKTVDEQSGLYKYQVEIINSDNNQESKVKTFIMKLEDSGTGFQISFNV